MQARQPDLYASHKPAYKCAPRKQSQLQHTVVPLKGRHEYGTDRMYICLPLPRLTSVLLLNSQGQESKRILDARTESTIAQRVIPTKVLSTATMISAIYKIKVDSAWWSLPFIWKSFPQSQSKKEEFVILFFLEGEEKRWITGSTGLPSYYFTCSAPAIMLGLAQV